jgi:hypothetical protein
LGPDRWHRRHKLGPSLFFARSQRRLDCIGHADVGLLEEVFIVTTGFECPTWRATVKGSSLLAINAETWLCRSP